MKPKFKHDCSNCVFLGCHLEKDIPLDLYACVRDGIIDTVIARWSSDGPDYTSGLIFAQEKSIPALTECLNRAIKMGFKVK